MRPSPWLAFSIVWGSSLATAHAGVAQPTDAPPPLDGAIAYPDGVVPREQLDGLAGTAERPGPRLTAGEGCAAKLKAAPGRVEGCDWSAPQIMGFSATTHQVAFLIDRNGDSHDDCQALVGVAIPLDKAHPTEAVTPLEQEKSDGCPQGTTTRGATAHWAARLAHDGWVDPTDLTVRRASVIWGAWGYSPVVTLRAPLQGYLLRVSDAGPDGKVTVDLIAPDNKKVQPLGVVNAKSEACAKDKKQCTTELPTIREVALSSDQKRLVLLLQLNTEELHDTTSRVVYHAFAVPLGALAP